MGREMIKDNLKYREKPAMNSDALHPAVQEFKELVESDKRLYMLAFAMFKEVPRKGLNGWINGGVAIPTVPDWLSFLKALTELIQTAPQWSEKAFFSGTVAFPLRCMLDWPISTTSGFAFFLDPDVNRVFKKVLNAWGEYLNSSASVYVLDTAPQSDGWLSLKALHHLTAAANIGFTARDDAKFHEIFDCDPTLPYYGFTSWDSFFGRRFRDCARPVVASDMNDSRVIINSCESRPYRIAYNVQARDQFWIKNEMYSVLDILADEPMASQFVGGTVYQAYLSAMSYHRWHAPVSGVVVKTQLIEGTYYSRPLLDEFDDKDSDKPAGKDDHFAQAYMAAMATRAVVYIESDDPAIGLMAFVGIGMMEVSTCETTVKVGDRVTKGEEIGTFHFGGSTYCMMFRNGVKLSGFPQPGGDSNLPVRARLAICSS